MSSFIGHSHLSGVVAVNQLDGDLDLSRVPDLELLIASRERSGTRVLVLDLRRVTFMDSSVLRLLLAADQRARREGRRLVLAVGEGAILRLLRITLLESRFELTDDPAAIRRTEGGGR